jgi:membrane-associated phospholipid phosphatase
VSPVDRPAASDPAWEPEATAPERIEREEARRSLRARLAGGPVLRAIGEADRVGMRFVRSQARSPRATSVIRVYSRAGEHGAVWLALGVGGAIVDPKRRGEWLRGAGTVVAAYAINTGLKQVARRDRPSFHDLPPLVKTPSQLSFPSSHSASSFAAATAYGPLLPGVPLKPIAASMALSRVHLGVHYPSDIAVGALLGTLIARALRPR